MSASADALIQELLSLLPAPRETLPATLAEVVDEAIQQAREGDLEMIVELIRSMRELESALRSGHHAPTHGLCNEAAAQCLAEIDPSRERESLVSAMERALELDPHAVEAMVMLGDLAENREQRVVWYQRASDAAQHNDPDAVQARMPQMRKHMGHSLVEAGSLTDAAQILLPALQENPADPDECRYPLVDVCLRLGWHDEVAKIVSQFPDDPLGPIDFAAALLAFAMQGDSADAQTLLVAAIRRHPGVAEYLVGAKHMPRVGERITAAVELRVTAAEYLLPSLREIEGTVNWLRNTWADLPDLQQDDEWDDSDGEPFEPFADDLLGLAVELDPEDTSWQLLIDKNTKAAGYVAIVLDDEDLIAARAFPKRPGSKELKQLILSAIGDPVVGLARKPQTLRVATKATVKSLERFCATFDVSVVQEKLTASELKKMRPVFDMIARGLQADSDQEQPITVASIEHLPISDEVWAYGLFRPPLWVAEGPAPTRPYLQLLFDVESGLIVHQHISDSMPTVGELAMELCRAMGNPMDGEPRQVPAVLVDPGTIDGQMPMDDSLIQQFDQQFSQTQILLGDQQTKHSFDTVIAEMLQLQSPVQGALRDLDGMDDTRLAEFYQILANFYRAKPWKMIGGDQLFEIHCEAWTSPRWTACVMGQLGQEFGISLYDNPSDAARLMEDPDPDFAEIQTLVVHYNEAFDTIPVDCWHRERNNWALAGPEAHPFVARFTRGKLQAATSQDIEVLMQIMPHVPRFLDHPANQTFSVGEAPHSMTFRWCS